MHSRDDQAGKRLLLPRIKHINRQPRYRLANYLASLRLYASRLCCNFNGLGNLFARIGVLQVAHHLNDGVNSLRVLLLSFAL